MKSKLLAIALSFLPFFSANAQEISRKEISALTHRIAASQSRVKKKIHGKNGSRVMHYYISPEHPGQGDSVTLFAEVQTDFAGEELLLQGNFDGAAATLEQPTQDLFILNLGAFNEISSHKFQGQIFIQSHSDAEQLRNALSQLSAQISSLNAQIAATTDPTLLAQLQAQLAQAQAEQAQLTQALVNLKTPVDEEDFSFEVQANAASPNFPHISGISPNVAHVNTTAQVTISGTSFSASPVVTIGGQSVTVSSSSATSIVGTAPAISAAGPQDVVVSFGSGSQGTNAVMKNGYFVTSSSVGGNPAPVAVASTTAASVPFTTPANFVSTGSNDPQQGTLSYQWQLISVPAGSHIPLPSTGTSAAYSIMPDVPGTFVASLVVTSSVSNLASAPSMAVVQAIPPPNQAPTLSGGSISIFTGQTKSLQLNMQDEPWQAHSYFISHAPSHGTATVSASGLVSYASGSAVGNDSFDVAVVDNGTPPLSASVTIPVTIVNRAPVASAPPITVQPDVSGTSQVNAYDRDPGQSVTLAITTAPANGTATISSAGLVTYTPNGGYVGPDSIGIGATDSASSPATTSFSIPVMVSNLTPPTLSQTVIGYSVFGNGVPYQLGIGYGPLATPISAGNGGVASVVWDYGDGTQERVGDFLYAGNYHYYVDRGNFTAVLTVTDRAGLTSSIAVPVTVPATDIELPVIHVTMTPSTGGAGPLTVSFDASSTTYSGTITQWRWQFCGQNPDVVTTTPTVTHTFTSACAVRVRGLDGATHAMGQTTINVPFGSTVAGSAPVSQFTAAPAREQLPGSTFSFDSVRSIDANVGGSLTNFVWNAGDFNCPNCGGAGATLNYAYNWAGSHFPTLTVTNALGMTNLTALQVWTINSPGTHAPHEILTTSGTKGVAPFTVTLSTAPSYAYEGATIVGTVWNFNDGTPNQTGTTVTHTFTALGAYNVVPTITDSDGNYTNFGQTISVTSPTPEPESVKDPSSPDPDRDMQRQILSASCAESNGASCYALSQMYAEDGDSYTAGLLKQKACSMGFQPACQQMSEK